MGEINSLSVHQVSGYQVTEPVYTGDRTLVYRGICDHNQQPVVIKILRNEYPNFNELVQFRNQYTIAKNLSFPSIIQPLALKIYNNGYALIMEDFGGVSLSTHLKPIQNDTQNDAEISSDSSENLLSLQDFLQIAIELTDILHYLYQSRVIHKDIKPANILINPDTKKIKLIDFSISSLLPRETQEIHNPNILEGTLAYLSPEQTGRMNRGIDYRSDFYSLGVTFYELLTGKLPFVSNEAMELVHCHLAQQPLAIHEVNPAIPAVLSEIISKLMAKNAEDRYQSALGIKHDLEICLEQLQATGSIKYFTIGERDLCDRFLIPEKLYGRETEVQSLLDAFDRVSNGSTEMMLVAGFSGIGKTVVVNEVHKPIAKQQGYFIKGKYDQFQRNIPFSAFVHAFRDLMGQLLSESDEQLTTWKTKILAAVGENGQILIEVIPELERIIDKQPPVIELSGAGAQNRFNLLMQKFVQVFATADHPLVMFLDDLQWADYASLNLLQLLMQDIGNLLILGAYRDNEVSPVHPFIILVEEIIKSGSLVNTITLSPLSLENLNLLIADTLNCELALAQPLTELIYQKTKGNPFFATQFLKALYEDELITFAPLQSHLVQGERQGGWQCDIAKVRALAITDDVVEFMALQLQKLSPETQNILKLAACIGAQFDLHTLAIISEQSAEVAAIALWKSLQEGLVIPTTEAYKFFTQSDSVLIADAAANPTYRFLHDRIQQAAYSLIPHDQKQAVHYQIGQLLLSNLSETQRNHKLFDIVNHMNLGQDCLDQKNEHEQLARLNLAAGQKAISSTAYAAATQYLETGVRLLDEDAWINQYELLFSLYYNLATAQLNGTNYDQLAATITLVLQNINSPIDRAEIHIFEVTQYTLQGRYQEAIQAGLTGLKNLGIEINSKELTTYARKEFDWISGHLKNRSISSLLDLPNSMNPTVQAAIKLLVSLDPPAYITGNIELYSLASFKAIHLSIEHGNIAESIKAYANYGFLLGLMEQQYLRGCEFADLAMQLSYKLNSKSQRSRAGALIAGWIQVWAKPVAEAVNINYESFLAGMESGDMQFAAYNLLGNVFNQLFQGKDLKAIAEDIERYWLIAEKIQDELLSVALAGAKIFVSKLCSIQNQQEQDPGIVEAERIIRRGKTSQTWLSISLHYILEMHFSYLMENFEQSVNSAIEAKKILNAIVGFTTSSSYYYYGSLILLQTCSNLPPEEISNALKQVESNQELLKMWSESCPENFLHKYLLVEAERYRYGGEKSEVIELYDRAISEAKANEFTNEEALANELAAKFYLEWGKEKVAQGYMIEAYYCYARWGAKAKVVDLETRYPQLLAPILQQSKSSFDPLATLTTITISSGKVSSSSGSTISDSLDFASVIKAAQAMSSTIQLEELLQELTQIILQNSGGDKCILILPQNDLWQVKAISTLNSTQLLSEPLESSSQIPIKLIHYIKRTKTVIVIDSLLTDLPVIGDYLEQHQPKSVLGLPILNQGELVGILYLENQSTAGVFTIDRLTVIEFFCTQAAISLTNANLYQQAQIYAQQLEESQLQIIQSEKMSALGNLVAGIAHEINNPVGFISGNLNEAKMGLTDLINYVNLHQSQASVAQLQECAEEIDLEYLLEDLPKMIDSMQVGCDRIKGISTSLRTFSRADTDHPIPTNIHEGIDSTIMILKHRLKADENRPEIEVIKDYGYLPKIECYAGQLNQVFMNLLANAIDALEESNQGKTYGEINNQIAITTCVSLDKKQVVISIKDNGKGMSTEVQQKIFEHLFTTKGVGKGTGLGLAIARQIIVEKHGGTINVNSELGKGTEFTIMLPLNN